MTDADRYASARLSDPRYEQDGLRFLSFESDALGGRGDITVFAPPAFESKRNLPLVMLLHGAYGSHWAWAFRGGAHRIARDLLDRNLIRPMVLVMPSDGGWGATTGCLPAPSGPNYETWIMNDVVNAVTTLIPGLGHGSPLFLAGHSMGGFAALRLGGKFPERVRGIYAHSSVTDLAQLVVFAPPESRVPTPTDEADRSVLPWLRKNAKRLPPLHFDCGRGDPLIERNRTLDRDLTSAGIAHQFTEHDGGHDWDYWSARLPDTLRFFSRLSDDLRRSPTTELVIPE